MRSTKTNYLKSNSLPYTDGGTVSFAHNWSNFNPATDFVRVQAWAVCIEDDRGWQPGARISLFMGVTIAIDSSAIALQIRDRGVTVISANNSTQVRINPGRWEIYVTAVREK